jgi:hypothetical protein
MCRRKESQKGSIHEKQGAPSLAQKQLEQNLTCGPCMTLVPCSCLSTTAAATRCGLSDAASQNSEERR